MVVLWPSQRPLPVKILRQKALDYTGVLLTIIEEAEDLLFDVFGWSDVALPVALRAFTISVLARLKEIEANEQSLELWVSLFEELESSNSDPIVDEN
jgi:hypothetical protein